MFKKIIRGSNVLVLESSDLINSNNEINTSNFTPLCRKEIRKHDWIIFKNGTNYSRFQNKRPYSKYALSIVIEEISNEGK